MRAILVKGRVKADLEKVYGMAEMVEGIWTFAKDDCEISIEGEVLHEILMKTLFRSPLRGEVKVKLKTLTPYVISPICVKRMKNGEFAIEKLEAQPIPDLISGLYLFSEFFSFKEILDEIKRGYVRLSGYSDLKTVPLNKLNKKGLIGEFTLSLDPKAFYTKYLFQSLPVLPLGSFGKEGLGFLAVEEVKERKKFQEKPK